jgi:hypothetical protein
MEHKVIPVKLYKFVLPDNFTPDKEIGSVNKIATGVLKQNIQAKQSAKATHSTLFAP